MKTKIKIKEITEGCMPSVINVGDWIDLRSAVTINNNNFNEHFEKRIAYIPLGVAIQLPDGYEAIVAPRSSTPKKFGIAAANSFGIIDNTYCGNNDEWNFIAYVIGRVNIKKGERICQFRIQLSQRATFWQKVKHFFSSGIELVQVENLEGEDRGGIGSTGKK